MADHNQPNPDNVTPDYDDAVRTYTLNRARKRLNLHKMTVERAIDRGVLRGFHDDDDILYVYADDVDQALRDMTLYEAIAETERIKLKDLADALDVKLAHARKLLRDVGANQNRPNWGDIRARWELPDTLPAFQQRVQDQRDIRRKARRAKRAEKKRRRAERKEAERQRRAELRAQLVASFPAWSELDRADQMMMLHIGPPNSGKTHDSLQRLSEAGRGWYLAPLRLLAWEVFDRLNQQGVPCNLLTGEEYVPVEGAEITAATIEMFNAQTSGDVVIIDEAQMLADADRGWAWTRAMMQCLAPEMHVIAPPTAKMLIHKMAKAANIPLGTVFHERLAPISVADEPWSLKNMPPKTILVAFSRKMVLTLKTRLENYQRSVSVVYGSLPPEVRRKQAERFASGETDICVATDAVGMGLNLPADHVCFYEIEKYDGREIRLLKPAEVQQIGGRAGRYGFSKTGLVGATSGTDLRLVKSLFYADAEILTHARVAPSVDDLRLIPGTLAERLQEWGRLQSIPEQLRTAIKTADLNERIELASMLTDIQVAKLGLASALQLVNAPTRKSTRDFWFDCATAIIDEMPMPLPPDPPTEILDTGDLDYTEMCIAAADIYLWLGYRREFHHVAEHMEEVKQDRRAWSDRIDEALLSKIRTAYRDDYRRY